MLIQARPPRFGAPVRIPCPADCKIEGPHAHALMPEIRDDERGEAKVMRPPFPDAIHNPGKPYA